MLTEVKEITEIIRFKLPIIYQEIFIISAFFINKVISLLKFESLEKYVTELFFFVVFAIIFKTSSLIWGLRSTLLYGIVFLLF
jgi:hypothetical protein